MKSLLAALVVVSALGLTAAGAVAGVPSSPASTASASQTTLSPLLRIHDSLGGFLDGMQNLIERLDEFLEAVVDLLETLNDLFGGGEGGDD